MEVTQFIGVVNLLIAHKVGCGGNKCIFRHAQAGAILSGYEIVHGWCQDLGCAPCCMHVLVVPHVAQAVVYWGGVGVGGGGAAPPMGAHAPHPTHPGSPPPHPCSHAREQRRLQHQEWVAHRYPAMEPTMIAGGCGPECAQHPQKP